MHPAFSVILFTTLSGTGYGLLAWLGLHAAQHPGGMPRSVMLTSMALALLLVTAGLLASLWHLGKPLRAWRAFSQWRTSWLSREGVSAVVTYVPALLLVLASWNGDAGAWSRIAGMVLAACSLITVACTAMIYASLPPIAAWRDRAVVPLYLGYALLGGSLWSTTLLVLFGWRPLIGELVPVLLLVIVVAGLKLDYWRRIDRAPAAFSIADATGLAAFGEVRSFERPNTESNYLLNEMGYVLARRHARRLRSIAILLGLATPLVAAVAAVAWPPLALASLLIASLAFQLGAMVERWLFFAQARHTIALYYGVAGARD